MSKTAIKIGPADNGRRMSLEDFELAEEQGGYLYELSRGIITVSDVPNRLHLFIVAAIRNFLQAYMAIHPGRIQIIAAGQRMQIVDRRFRVGASSRPFALLDRPHPRSTTKRSGPCGSPRS